MQTFNSRSFTIKKDVKSVYDLFMNPKSASSFLEKQGDKVPLKNIVLNDNGLELEAPVVGKIKVERTENLEPSLIRYQGKGTPVPMLLNINLLPGENANETIAQISVDAEVPAFMSGMIGSKIQPALEKAAEALEHLDVDRFLGK